MPHRTLHLPRTAKPPEDYPPSFPPTPLTPRDDPLASSFATTYSGVVAFIAVVAEGSFARAADRLGIGRSAVSRSVQRLEDQLSVRLFTRTTRSTCLTREGDLFYARCHTGVDRIAQAVEEMRDLQEGPPRGHLRIGSAVGFGRRVVAPLLSEFQVAYPDVLIDLLVSDEPTDFISDRVDIAFRHGSMEDAQIIAKQIIPMRMLLCAPRTISEVTDCPPPWKSWHIISASASALRRAASSSGDSKWTVSLASSCRARSSPTTTPTWFFKPWSTAKESLRCRAT